MPSLRTRLNVTHLESRDNPSTTNLFDASWYLARNPDVAAAVQRGEITAEDHFRRFGDAERRAGNALFDASAYLDDNPDVKAAVQVRSTTAFRHFELHGQFENRNPSHVFSSRDYLTDYPDVRSAVQSRQFSAFEHFLRHGQFEDRLPYHGFDRSAYLDDNPDVAVAVSRRQMTAVFHMENHGRQEGRRIRSSTPTTLPPGQTTTLTGTSQNKDDRKVFNFTPPASGTLRLVVESLNGVFAKAEVENALTSVDVVETQPNDGINSASGAVTGGVPYLLRVRAPGSTAAQFVVKMTIS